MPAVPAAPAPPPPRAPRVVRLPTNGTATKRLAAVRKLHGRRRRAAWRQRLVDAERGLVLGFRRDGVLAGHLFVLTLSVAAGLTFELSAVRWAVLGLALATAMAAELFGQVLAALTAALVRHADDDAPEDLAAAMRLGSAAAAISAIGATAALVAVFAPPVVAAFGG